MNNIYIIKRAISVKESDYDEESYRKAIEDERIKELMHTDAFKCEYFPSNTIREQMLLSPIRYTTVNLLNTCGKIIEITDDNIKIQLNQATMVGDLLKEILEKPDAVMAHMRALGKYKNGKFIINKIITFDILPCNMEECDMLNREYAELLDYIKERSNELANVSVFRVHSSYDPKSNQIGKVALKVNYTKDGAPLSTAFNAKGKPTKNLMQKSIQFRGDRCTKEEVITWLDNFMQEKG